MKYIHFILFLFLFMLSSPQLFAADNKSTYETEVKVRLEKNLERFLVSGFNLKINHQPLLQNDRAAIGYVRLEITRKNFAWMIKIDSDKNEKLFKTKILEISGENLRTALKKLPSKLRLITEQEKYHLVGVLPLEEYLIGVVAHEMSPSWPLETLKAQAIAARSYTLSVMKEKSKKPWSLESTTEDQVFSQVQVDQNKYKNVKKAVEETQGFVLLKADRKKMKIVKAYYHADCGGETASTRSVWGYGENDGQVHDATCATRKKSNWVYKIEKSSLARLMNLNTLEGYFFSPQFKHDSQRVRSLLVFNRDRKEVFDFAATELRAKIGPEKLKSTTFEITESSDSVIFKGQGFGHGVGLCQWGSRDLALQGKNHFEILKHYYSRATLQKIDSQTLF